MGSLHLEAIAIFQHPSNLERLRAVQVYSQAGNFRALRQDFLLSPHGYHVLEDPTVKSLECEEEIAKFVNLQKECNQAEGWRSLLEFAVFLPFPNRLDPMLSPKRNPSLINLPTLVNDLNFVEAVLDYLAAGSSADAEKLDPPASQNSTVSEGLQNHHQRSNPLQDYASITPPLHKQLPGASTAPLEVEYKDTLLRSLGRFVDSPPLENPASTGHTFQDPGVQAFLPTTSQPPSGINRVLQPDLLASWLESSIAPPTFEPGKRPSQLQIQIPKPPDAEFASPDSVLFRYPPTQDANHWALPLLQNASTDRLRRCNSSPFISGWSGQSPDSLTPRVGAQTSRHPAPKHNWGIVPQPPMRTMSVPNQKPLPISKSTELSLGTFVPPRPASAPQGSLPQAPFELPERLSLVGGPSSGQFDASPVGTESSDGSDLLSPSSFAPPGGPLRSASEGSLPVFGFRATQPQRMGQMTLDEMQPYFDMPIKEACKRLGVGATILKRHCRQLGVARWPYRKIKSIQGLIRAIEGFGTDDTSLSNQVNHVVEQLRMEKERIDQSPDKDLAAGTKKLRQACFKATYQMKNGKIPPAMKPTGSDPSMEFDPQPNLITTPEPNEGGLQGRDHPDDQGCNRSPVRVDCVVIVG